jgi:hypothetical protein
MVGFLVLRIGLGVLLIFFLLWLRKVASRERAAGRQGALVFHASLALRLLFFGFAVAFVFFVTQARQDRWAALASSLLAAALLAILFAWPAPIVLDGEGIKQIYWWRSNKRITWSQVMAMSRAMRSSLLVYGDEGTIIRFSPLHVDRGTFELEVTERAHIQRFV